MKVKFDFTITPDGCHNTGPFRAHHVKGAVSLPKGPLYAILAAMLTSRIHSVGDGFNSAGDLLEKIGREVADG